MHVRAYLKQRKHTNFVRMLIKRAWPFVDVDADDDNTVSLYGCVVGGMYGRHRSLAGGKHRVARVQQGMQSAF